MSFIQPDTKLHIIKYEPSQILLKDHSTQQIYKYAEINKPSPRALKHSIIVEGMEVGTGLIYPKQCSNLLVELEKRSSVCPFEEGQLENSFEGIIKFLADGQTYGALCPENIIIDSNQQIKLRDRRIGSQSHLYYEHPNYSNDRKALALIIVQCSTLKPIQAVKTIVQNENLLIESLNNYSHKFIASVLGLLKNQQQLDQDLFKEEGSEEYNDLLEKVRKTKEKVQILEKVNQEIPRRKVVVVPPLNLSKKGEIVEKNKNKRESPKQNIISRAKLNSKKKPQKMNSFKFTGKQKLEMFVRIQKKVKKNGGNKLINIFDKI